MGEMQFIEDGDGTETSAASWTAPPEVIEHHLNREVPKDLADILEELSVKIEHTNKLLEGLYELAQESNYRDKRIAASLERIAATADSIRARMSA